MEERILMIVHDLEEKIMRVWNTSDDLDAVLHFTEDAEIPRDCVDELMNMIIGIKTLHERKSKMLFEEFEKVLKSNKEAEEESEREVDKLKNCVSNDIGFGE